MGNASDCLGKFVGGAMLLILLKYINHHFGMLLLQRPWFKEGGTLGMITVVCRFLTDDWSSLVMTPDSVLRDLDE